MIAIRDLTFTYKDEKNPALREVSLDIPEGGFLGVTGPAGAGKTTLIRAVSGMIPHLYPGDFYGSVTVNGMDTFETSLAEISRQVGTVFQDVDSQIISPMVEDELLYGLENFGVPREEIPERIGEALRKVGIPDLRYRDIASLSGGQRQKTAVAAIIALRPRVLLLDEPTGELDPHSSLQVFSLLKELNEEQGVTVIVVEQKIMLLCEFAKQLAVMNGGRIAFQGETRKVLAHAEEMQDLGINIPRVTTLSRALSAGTGREQPVCINLDEAEAMVRGLMK